MNFQIQMRRRGENYYSAMRSGVIDLEIELYFPPLSRDIDLGTLQMDFLEANENGKSVLSLLSIKVFSIGYNFACHGFTDFQSSITSQTTPGTAIMGSFRGSKYLINLGLPGTDLTSDTVTETSDNMVSS